MIAHSFQYCHVYVYLLVFVLQSDLFALLQTLITIHQRYTE